MFKQLKEVIYRTNARVMCALMLLDDVQKIKTTLEEYQHWDVANLLKQYIKELPGSLVTPKWSTTFINIFLCKS
jgi:hypothetical protein